MVVNEIVVETVVNRNDGGKFGGQENRDYHKRGKAQEIYTPGKERNEMMNRDGKREE